MRTESIRTENANHEHGMKRYGIVADSAKREKNHKQNIAITSEIDSSRTKKRPEPLQLTARAFQLELYRRAKQRNTIAVLDTGSGKTFIASLLIRDVLHLEMEARKAARDQNLPRETKLAFFIVDKVALAHQQAEFLQRTCFGRIGLLYGALGVDNYSRAQWRDVYLDYDVLVLTADILKNALARGFLVMERANLLVFDEAHHCQAIHAYAAIQHFYHKTLGPQRPRIFGMTASPVSRSRCKPESVIFELEQRLDATICTPDPGSDLSNYVIRPEEMEVYYPRAEKKSFQAPILCELEVLLSPIKFMRKFLSNADFVGQSLGTWASIVRMKRMCNDSQWRIEAKATTHQSGQNDYERDTIQVAKDKIMAYPDPDARAVLTSMTPKMDKLLGLLRDIYLPSVASHEETPVTIVFCERRSTAYLLMIAVNEYVKDSMPENLKASLFIGHGGTEEGDISMPMQRQALVVEHFRQNKSNCLFATSVAEEGIDIPACNYVIKFDPSQSCLQYIQSRGRARKSGSSYITLLEEGDTAAKAHYMQVKEGEQNIRDLCRSLPQDRIVQFDDNNDTTSVRDGPIASFAAISVVEMYCRSLPADEFVSMRPEFTIDVSGLGFVATCQLPPVSQIPLIRGTVQKNKRDAKTDAASNAVAELIRRDLIDEVYNPRYHKDLEMAPEDDELESDYTIKGDHPVRLPRFWHGGKPTKLFLTRVVPKRQGLTAYTSLLLITKDRALPVLPPLSFYNRDEEFQICCSNLAVGVKLNETQLNILQGFTNRLWKVMINKVFQGHLTEYPYFLAIDTGSDSAADAINWVEMEESYYDRHEPLTAHALERGLVDKIVKEHNHNAYHFVHSVRPDLSPDSPVPSDDKRSKNGEPMIRSWPEKMYPTNGKALSEQPILEVVALKRTLNFLTPPQAQKSSDSPAVSPSCKKTYLIPQFCDLVNMRGSVVSTSFLIPSLMTRIESYLHAQELNEYMGTEIDLSVLVAAITTKQANHGVDYERLEYLGDAYLKLITTVAVYIKYPHFHEGLLTMRRTAIIENKNLRKQALKRRLYCFPFAPLASYFTDRRIRDGVIQAESFSKKAWRPAFLLVEDETQVPVRSRKLGDKQIADVVEAIIGAAVLSSGFDTGLRAAVALGVETYGMTSWHAARTIYHEPRFLAKKRFVAGEDAVYEAFGYRFNNSNYLLQALQHGSCAIDESDPIPSYDRLELVGDAVLEIEVALWLFKTYPQYDPDRLTKMKSHMVRNKSLGCLCEALGIQKFLRHFNGGIPTAIVAYSQELAFLKARNQKRDYYLDTEPPKFFSDIIESIIGAIYLDQGMRTEAVRRLFHKCFLTRLDPDIDYSKDKPVMAVLTHLLQKSGCEMFYIKRHEHTEYPLLTHQIAHKGSVPKRTVTLTLIIHEAQICVVEAPSYGLAKLKLAEEALSALRTDQQAERPLTEIITISLKDLCSCPPKLKKSDQHIEDEEFRF